MEPSTTITDLESQLPAKAQSNILLLRRFDPALSSDASVVEVVTHALEVAASHLVAGPYPGHEDLSDLPELELPDWDKVRLDMLRKKGFGGGSSGGGAGGTGGGPSL